jgi:NAD(P)-dependent dehydrogenase (short-subunit alcohol dehydrogenase family)
MQVSPLSIVSLPGFALTQPLCTRPAERLAKSADGFELTWAVNVLAPFLLTSLLVDRVTSQVVTTSSISASSSLDMGNLQQERGFR